MFLGNLKDGGLPCDIQPLIALIIERIRSGYFDRLLPGRYTLSEARTELLVQEYETVDAREVFFEKHERSAELIYIASGCETVCWCRGSALGEPITEYEEQKDRRFYSDPENSIEFALDAGSYILVGPEDGHKTRCQNGGKSSFVRKYLVKMWP